MNFSSSLRASASSPPLLTPTRSLTVAFPAMAQNRDPFSRPFFLRLKYVRYEEDPNTPTPAQGPDFYWLPSSSGRFINEGSSGWWIWDPGQGEAAQRFLHLRRPTEEENQRRAPYRSCTMLWTPDRHGYLHLPADCTTTNVSSLSNTWRRLSFGRSQHPDRARIAFIGYSLEDYKLHIPGPNRWFEQLLPDVCQAQNTVARRCTLAGDLSILVGLVAFSSVPQYALYAVDQSFRPDLGSTQFTPNQLPKAESELPGT